MVSISASYLLKAQVNGLSEQENGLSAWPWGALLSLVGCFRDAMPPHRLTTYRAHTSNIPTAPSTPVQPEVTT